MPTSATNVPSGTIPTGPSTPRTLFYVAVLGVLCAVAAWLALRAAGIPLSGAYIALLVYFPVASGALLAWQEHALAVNAMGFVRRFLVGLVVKLIGSLVLLFFLARSVPHSELGALVVTCTLLYGVWLGFSAGRLSMHLRRSSGAMA